MYINFWYPVARSEDIQDRPQRIRMLGQNFAVWRDGEGEVHVLHNVCIHRGGSLGDGWFNHKHSAIVCPYHGWEFASNGRCVAIPSLGYDATPPPAARVDSYPVQEKYGLIFAFLGDLPENERPGIIDIPEYNDPNWRHNGETPVIDLDFSTERSIENGLDPGHAEFVHPTQGFSGRRPESYRLNPVRVVEDEPWGSHFDHVFNEAPPLDELTYGNVRPMEGAVAVTSGHWGPNVLFTKIRPSPTTAFHQYFIETPIDAQRTRVFFINLRNFLLEEFMDQRIMQRNLAIAQEDIDILNRVEPVQTPASGNHELLMPADSAVVKYREMLRRFDARGWRIDTDLISGTRYNTTYAIPSPARRTGGPWVLPATPLAAPGPQRGAPPLVRSA